ncbi:MAG: T9SS type A sorting domain-containing protein, partial [Cytophagales bacterium]|nr:T9SS type A sorting domain-containing protein [Cytophagales bacterium]
SETRYYVYALSVKGAQRSAQEFSPDRYATGSIPPPDLQPLSQGPSSRSVVYPNPSRGLVYISGAGSDDVVAVYSGSGVYLGRYVLSSQRGIDLSALNAGLYILEHKGIRYRVIIE